ncbi:MAG TPA: nuclear transport factor 2 family protein [Candidatus Binataceae bacterium]|nr:nuclear transport factor 2 family protein [Candidatus Binataceae bacterium]
MPLLFPISRIGCSSDRTQGPRDKPNRNPDDQEARKMEDAANIMARIPFYKLVASGVDLASAFKSAVDAFNGRDLTTLMNLCDDNVVLVTVKRQMYFCGKQRVSDFLAEQFRMKKPTFLPTTTETTINPSGTIAHIIGAAEWTDYEPNEPQGTRFDGTIRYAFNFINRGNGWLISTAWGSTDLLGPQP